MASLFSKFFPMPRALAMHGGGLEISDRSIKYLLLKGRAGGRRNIISFGEVPLPQGAVEGGTIVDRDALTAALASVRKQCGFSLCFCSLPEGRGYLFSTTLPRPKRNDLLGALALALPENVPLSPAEAVFDCRVIPEESNDETLAVAVAAFSEDLASAYAGVLMDAGFLPLSFELEPQAAARAVVPSGITDGAVIIIDFGETKTMLCIVENGAARFTTSIEGSAALDETLAKGGADGREILRLKTDVGLANKSWSGSEVFVSMAERLAGEIKRLSGYWNARKGLQGGSAPGSTIEGVLLYGGNANLKGLPEYLARAISLPVRVANIWSPLPNASRTVHPIPRDQSMRFCVVAGLAMRTFTPLLSSGINLLPEPARREARREYLRRVISVSAFMAAAVCAAGAALMLPISYGLKEDRASVLLSQTQINAELADPSAASTTAAVRQASTMLDAANKDTALPRPSAVLQLMLFARPAGVSVREITFTAGQPISLTINGLAATRDDLLAFKSALLAVPGVKNADFPPADLAASSTVSFSMKVMYAPPPQTAVVPLPKETTTLKTASSTASNTPAAPKPKPAASSTSSTTKP
ncbi:MAG: pilus assembly protein PilM [Minisyncoccia bacterium]